MRRLTPLLLALAILISGCTSGSDEPEPTPTSAADDRAVTLEALRLDWPTAQGKLVVGKPPATPDGFDDATLTRMATVLKKWAKVAAVDDAVWHSADPFAAIKKALPAKAAATLTRQLKGEVSPHLAVANVFGDDVTVVGTPMITTAWKMTTDKDEAGKPYVLLELQTRAAYEVRLGNGVSRVIGVLRVHGLSAYKDTTDDFGVGGGWQEFGAGDCALALDDALVPDSDREAGLKDLATFIRVGKGTKLEMPKLPVQEQVDDEYLKRCRDGQV
jgi:hypothetical protein